MFLRMETRVHDLPQATNVSFPQSGFGDDDNKELFFQKHKDNILKKGEVAGLSKYLNASYLNGNYEKFVDRKLRNIVNRDTFTVRLLSL